jgi:hypothetical protein
MDPAAPSDLHGQRDGGERVAETEFQRAVPTVSEVTTRERRTDVKYALFIYQGAAGEEYWRGLSEEEQEAMRSGYQALGQEPGIFGSEQLHSPETAKTVRVEDGKTLTTDGPASNDTLGGFYLLEAKDIDHALEVAARIPAARLGGAVEVRQIVER